MSVPYDPNFSRDILTNQALKVLTLDATAHLMAANLISPILVIKNKRLAGIVTARDLTANFFAGSRNPNATVLSGVMTANVDTLSLNVSPFNALNLMSLQGYQQLPVVEGASVIGMLSIRGSCTAVKDTLEEDIRQLVAFIFDKGYDESA